MKRPIIEIDEEKCNGCGKCILDCAEGALKIVNGKAKLVSEVYCDGLGACLNCPQGALRLEMKEAPPFDEGAAMAAKAREKQKKSTPFRMAHDSQAEATQPAVYSSWPIQLALVPPNAGFLKNADLLLGAHCAGFTLPSLQADWLKGRIPLIACPKLEDNAMLAHKLASILKNNDINSLTILRMSVPCCNLPKIAADAIQEAGIDLAPKVNIVQL